MLENELLTREEVLSLCRIRKSALYDYMRRGNFPLPVKMSKRCVRWWKHEVMAWLEALPRATGDGDVA